MASEVGSGQVAIFPVFKGFRKAVTREIDGAEREGSSRFSKGFARSSRDAGSQAGTGFRRGFAEASAGLSKSLQADVAKAAAAVSASRLREQDAAGKTRVAEAQLAEARKKYADDSSQVIRAEERLASSQRALQASQEATKASTERLKGAQASLASASEATAGRVRRSFSDMASSVSSSLGSVSSGFSKAGAGITAAGGALTASITKPALGAATAVGGLVGALGFKRLVGIDTARGQFKGLGMDADAVMSQVEKGVNNTALSMADGAALAVGALATGNLPLDGLEAQLKRVANVSAAYGVDSKQAGTLLNKVLTKNKVTYGDLSQMVGNGIPIISQLAKHYGVAGDEIEKMASDGKISIEDFNATLDQNAGAAAESYAKTWKGITANILSNLGKIGAKALGPTFDIIKDSAAGLLATLRSPEFTQWADRFGKALGGILDLVVRGNFSANLREAFGWEEDSPIVDKILTIRDAISGLFDVIVKGNFSAKLREVFGWEEDSPIVGFLFTVHENLGKIVVAALALGPALSIFGKITSVVGVAVGGVSKFVGWVGRLSAMFAGAAGGAGGFLSTILRFAGPIGLIVSAFVAMWTQSEQFRTSIMALGQVLFSVVQQVFAAIMPILQQLMPIFAQLGAAVAQVFTALMPMFAELGNVVGAILTAVLPVVEVLVGTLGPAISGLLVIVQAVFEAVAPIIDAALQVVMGIVQTFTALLRGDWSGVWEGIKAILSGALEVVKSVIQGAVGIIQGIFSGLGTFLGGIWSNISSGVTSAWDGIMSFLRGVPDTIKGFFSGAGSWLLEAGKDVIRGLGNGIKNMGQWVVDQVGGVVDGAINGAKKLLGIHSPSRVFRVIGEYTGEGLADGIASQRARVAGATGSIVDAARNVADGVRLSTPGIGAGSSYAVAGGASGAAQVVQNITTVQTDPRLQIRQWASEAERAFASS